MRRILLGSMLLIGLGAFAAPARAQVGGGVFTDPFSFYYGYFIPSRAYQASVPKVEDTLRYYSAQRQVSALTERAGLFDPLGATGGGFTDPLAAFGTAEGVGGRRLPRTAMTGQVNMNVNGSGPSLYYNRVSQYYPNLRVGRGPNQNLAPVSRGMRGGGMGMPSMPGIPR